MSLCQKFNLLEYSCKNNHRGIEMKISTAVATRLSEILRERKMSQYRLEKISAVPHNTMKTIMAERNNGVNLTTVLQLVRGLGMTAGEFFNDPIFEREDLELYN